MKRWYPFLLTGLLILVLAGCGNAPSTAAMSTGGTTPATSTFTSLLVVRRASNMPDTTYPALDRTLTDATTINQLHRMAVALPLAPSGTINCPMDLGIEYQLTFNQASQPPQTMTLDATGCQFLHIASDPQQTRVSNAAFRNLLARMLDLPSLLPKRTS